VSLSSLLCLSFSANAICLSPPTEILFSFILFFLINGRAIFSFCDCYYDWMIEQWRVAAKKKMAALFLSVCERSFYLIVWEGEGMDRYIYTLDLKRRRSIASRLFFLKKNCSAKGKIMSNFIFKFIFLLVSQISSRHSTFVILSIL